MPAGAKPRTRFGPIWKWSSMRSSLPPQPAMWPPCKLEHRDDVGEHLVVAARFGGRADEVHVAADAGEVLLELEHRGRWSGSGCCRACCRRRCSRASTPARRPRPVPCGRQARLRRRRSSRCPADAWHRFRCLDTPIAVDERWRIDTVVQIVTAARFSADRCCSAPGTTISSLSAKPARSAAPIVLLS